MYSIDRSIFNIFQDFIIDPISILYWILDFIINKQQIGRNIQIEVQFKILETNKIIIIINDDDEKIEIEIEIEMG